MTFVNQNNELNPLPAYIFNAVQVIKNVPEKLKNIKNWVLWNFEERKGNKTKVLKQVNGANAKANDSNTWASFNDVLKHAHKFNGIGFVLAEDTQITVIDLDHVSEWTEEAQEIIDNFDSYAETSPSGDGVHIIVEGKKPLSLCKSAKFHGSKVEVYDHSRFITITGHKLEDKPANIAAADMELSFLLENMTLSATNKPSSISQISYDPKTGLYSIFNLEPSTVESPQNNGIESYYSRLKNCGKDNAINMLNNGYSDSDDASACDLAVCNDLAYVTAKNPILMDQIFRESAMMRPKWDELRGVQTYGQLTIEKAINDTKNVYSDKSLKSVESPITAAVKKRKTFKDYAINSQLEILKEDVGERVYILEDLAVKCQSTIIYASGNAGKTLITIKLLIDAVKNGVVKGENIFYINADDGLDGIVEKGLILNEYGIQVLSPGYNEFDEDCLQDIVNSTIAEGLAKDAVIVLDTMKKFANPMDKNSLKAYGKILRAFTRFGGTAITLAHTNKNAGLDGKQVFEGTSDSRNDSDCTYILEVTKEVNDEVPGLNLSISEKTVQFSKGKQRGAGAEKKTYWYRTVQDESYQSMLDTVKKLDDKQVKTEQAHDYMDKQLADNDDVIQLALEEIRAGNNQKTALVDAIYSRAKESGNSRTKKKILKILDAHSGDKFEWGHRWECVQGFKNSVSYTETFKLSFVG